MKKAGSGHSITGVFVFMLLGIFAVTSVLMVLLGVRFYRAQTQRTEMTGELRILSSYVRSMVRSEDEAGKLGTDQIDGMDMLTLTEAYDEVQYITRIYAWDGYLRESFQEAGYPFDPQLGEKIMEAEDFHASIEDGLVTVSLTGPLGQVVESRVAIRSTAGEQNQE